MKYLKRFLQGVILILFISAPTIKAIIHDYTDSPSMFWVFYILLLTLLILLK